VCLLLQLSEKPLEPMVQELAFESQFWYQELQKNQQHPQHSLKVTLTQKDFQLLVANWPFFVGSTLFVSKFVYQGIFQLRRLFSFSQYQTLWATLYFHQEQQLWSQGTLVSHVNLQQYELFFPIKLEDQTFKALAEALCQNFQQVYSFATRKDQQLKYGLWDIFLRR
jgi:hypothetical protein